MPNVAFQSVFMMFCTEMRDKITKICQGRVFLQRHKAFLTMKVINRIIGFLKMWLLPTAMVSGTVLYLMFANIGALAPFRHSALKLVEALMPVAVFATLFFTFCKMNVRDMKPRPWHAATLLLQTLLCLGCAFIIIKFMKPYSFPELVAEGVLACLLSPTATAAAVVTGKLGGSAASLTTYTLESNLLSALLVPLICPLIHPMPGIHVVEAFSVVLLRVSQLLVLPFVLAQFVKYVIPPLHRKITSLKNAAFYTWGITLVMVTGMTMRVVFAHLDRMMLVAGLVIAALAVCVFKFATGKFIGGFRSREDRISAGQAFGQKNTTFTIWMALTYLSPISAVAPGSYVIWQNIINSWQLWRHDKCQNAGAKNEQVADGK